jgi:hypothetical protein
MARKYWGGLVIRKCNESIWFTRVADDIPRPESDAPFTPYNTGNFFPDWATLKNKKNFYIYLTVHHDIN